MTQISARSLMIAIGYMVADRERLLLRIARATPAADEEERLSEMVVDIDKALGELGSEYEQQRTQAAAYPSYDDRVASVIESVKAESRVTAIAAGSRRPWSRTASPPAAIERVN